MAKQKDFMRTLSDAEIEKRIKAWADVTMLSLELKHAAMRKRHPELEEDELRELMRKELSMLKIK
jgi:hypothetical protein